MQKGTANGIIIPTARGPLRRVPLVGRQGRENMNLKIEYIPVKLAELADLPYGAMQQRIGNGWPIDDAVKTPYKSRKKWSEING